MYVYIYIYIYNNIHIYIYSGVVKPAQIQVTTSFINLGLVYPLPQPLINNRPWQCRCSAKGRHPVLKRYLGEGTHLIKIQPFANSVLWTVRAIVSNTNTNNTVSIPGPKCPPPQLLKGNINTSCCPSGAQHWYNQLKLHLVTDKHRPNKQHRRNENSKRGNKTGNGTQHKRSKARATIGSSPPVPINNRVCSSPNILPSRPGAVTILKI